MYYIDYDNSIVGVSNSVLKYFGVKPLHKTNAIVDKYLGEKSYRNVVVMLFDGLGYYNLKEHLSDSSFLIKNLKGKISSVFPSTTVAALTSLKTGLYPSEHMKLGWKMYYPELDDVVGVFNNKSAKGREYETNISDKYFPRKTVIELLNEIGVNSYEVSNYGGDIKYESLLEAKGILESKTKEEGSHYLFFYSDLPDKLMHEFGVKDQRVRDQVRNISRFVAQLNLEDTLLIVLADHGHVDIKESILLSDYPYLERALTAPLYIEPRAVGINLNSRCHRVLFDYMNTGLKNHFDLYSRDNLITNNIFGETSDTEGLVKYLPDFLLIAKGNSIFTAKSLDEALAIKGHHAGVTDKEGYVPLIIVDCKSKLEKE